MATADVSIKLDEPNRIWFAHSPYKALVFLLIAAAFTATCWYAIQDEPMVRMFFVGFSLLFVLAGVAGVFWRLEVDIDLVGRRVRIVRGMWPTPKVIVRQLDEADGVWLAIKYRSSGSKSKRKVPWWFVSLKFPEEKKGIRLAALSNEVDAYSKWEYYAERLRLNAVDATEKEPKRRSWEKLDENLASQTSDEHPEPVHAPNPPMGSTIELLSNRGRREILLPALGVSLGLVFLILFGGVFAIMGGSLLLAALGIIDIQVEGSETAINLIPPIFMLVGLGIIWLGVKGSYSATVIGVENSELFKEYLAFGKRSGRKSVPLIDIESVSVAGDVRSRHRSDGRIRVGGVSIGKRTYRRRDDEVVVRSDQGILRFGGSLSKEERTWLADACYYAAVKGQLP